MKPPMPSQTSPDQVELVFYEALQQGRLDALMACWSDEDEPVCVHPGGPRLIGLPAIAASYAALFEQGSVAVRAQRIHQMMWGSMALHSVVETVSLSTDDGAREVTVLATNVYVLTAAGWKMVAHHASPGQAGPVPHIPPTSKTLH